MKDVYLDFGGWLKLDPNTRMQYIGENETFDPIITVAVWQSLPKENRGKYILEDFVAAVRDSEDIEFNELTITDDGDDPEEILYEEFGPEDYLFDLLG